jgi:hypothetical protein
MGGPDGLFLPETKAEERKFMGAVHLLKPLSRADTQAIFGQIDAVLVAEGVLQGEIPPVLPLWVKAEDCSPLDAAAWVRLSDLVHSGHVAQSYFVWADDELRFERVPLEDMHPEAFAMLSAAILAGGGAGHGS